MKIIKNQKKLTKKQLEIAVQFAKEKIERYLAPEQWEEDKKLKLYVNNVYKVAGMKLPERIIFFDSTEAAIKHWDSVWDSVGAGVWDSVGASVRDSVGASVRDSVRAYYDSDALSFYKFFNDYFEENKLVWLQLLSENVTGYFFYEKECWLVRKPIRLTRDDGGRLHNDAEQAIGWKDGFGFYFLHGVRFDEKDLFDKIVEKKLSLKECMAIENMEQRMIALKYLGAEALLKNAKLIDHAKGYELYQVDKVFPRTQYFLKYTCPSTGREYLSGIDPEVGREKSAIKALEWKFYLEEGETFVAQS